LLLLQVCSDPPPMHCSTGIGKMHLPLYRAALQSRHTTCMCHCSYRFAKYAVTHHQRSLALVLAKCIYKCPGLLCNTGSQHACVTASTREKNCCSYKCAVTQQQCSAALVLARCIHHCPVLLCKTGSQHVCVTATTPEKIAAHTSVQ
jgi:hypothetical protein